MSLWTRFRTAIALSARIEELEVRFAALTSEWADVLDLLRKREERQRKRDSRAVKNYVSEDETPPSSSTTSSGDPKERKAQIRRMIAERNLKRG